MAEEILSGGQTNTDPGAAEGTQPEPTEGVQPEAENPASPEGTPPEGGEPEEPKPEGDQPEGENPEPVTIEFPEGVEVNEEIKGEFEKFVNDNKFTSEQAQALIEMQQKLYEDQAGATEKFFTERSEKWLEELKKDESFGGESFDANVAKVRQAMNTLDPDGDVRALLEENRLGDAPALVKMMARFTDLVSDDVLVKDKNGSAKPKTSLLFPPLSEELKNSD